MRKAYQTDLSDAEWSYIEPHLPTPKAPGRPRVHTLREILDAIFYIVRSRYAWRLLLPHDFAPWKTIHHYFRTWRLHGTWERVHAALRKRLRVRLKRDPQPSAGVVDSQSVKSIGVGGDQRGYDGGKKVKGRKCHILVDTEGLVLKAMVHSAKVMDYEGIKTLLKQADEMFPRLSSVAGRRLPRRGQGQGVGREDPGLERGSSGASPEARSKRSVNSLGQGVGQGRRCARLAEAPATAGLPGAAASVGSGADVFMGIDQNTRMSKDYERLPESGEAFIYVAMSRLMTRRLARS
jgi:putative transposase